MNDSGQNLLVETPNLVIKAMPSPISTREAPQLGAWRLSVSTGLNT